MASIGSLKNGTKVLRYFDATGKRRDIYLGRMPLELAEEVRANVESVISAKHFCVSVDAKTATWLASVAGPLKARLLKHGLVFEQNEVCSEPVFVVHKRPEYVYIMKHVCGLFKIGKATNPKVRERTLQAEDPRLELVAYALCGREVESKLHKIFADKRIRGEWFSLEQNHVDWITTFLQMKATC